MAAGFDLALAGAVILFMTLAKVFDGPVFTARATES